MVDGFRLGSKALCAWVQSRYRVEFRPLASKNARCCASFFSLGMPWWSYSGVLLYRLISVAEAHFEAPTGSREVPALRLGCADGRRRMPHSFGHGRCAGHGTRLTALAPHAYAVTASAAMSLISRRSGGLVVSGEFLPPLKQLMPKQCSQIRRAFQPAFLSSRSRNRSRSALRESFCSQNARLLSGTFE